MKNTKKAIDVKLSVDDTELTGFIEKVERLNELLKEANSLINELASGEIEIKTSVFQDSD